MVTSSSPATNKNDTYFDAATLVLLIISLLSGTWIGATSTDWNTASNWIGGVPTSATNAIIPSGPAYQPIVLNTPLAECNNLTIESGASLTINAGQALTAQGNINNSGTLNLNSSETAIASLILDSYTDNGTENIELFLTGGGDESNFPWHYISSPVLHYQQTFLQPEIIAHMIWQHIMRTIPVLIKTLDGLPGMDGTIQLRVTRQVRLLLIFLSQGKGIIFIFMNQV